MFPQFSAISLDQFPGAGRPGVLMGHDVLRMVVLNEMKSCDTTGRVPANLPIGSHR
jgi:hypothetical protein